MSYVCVNGSPRHKKGTVISDLEYSRMVSELKRYYNKVEKKPAPKPKPIPEPKLITENKSEVKPEDVKKEPTAISSKSLTTSKSSYKLKEKK